MDNSGMYVGLDIGTTSIKVIVAEEVKGQMNVLGVGNSSSEGVDRGIIVDIDKAAQSIKQAVSQAEEKASIQISDVVVGIPANLIKIEPCSGMVAISDQSREIRDTDVQQVTISAMVKNLPPERQVIDAIPDQFIVDGFDGIKDPRGMVGVRLEMRGHIITGPKTIIHNVERAVQKAGLTIESTIVSPLALGKYVLNDGEQDFGTILIDLGGGQSTASVIHDRQLKYTTVDKEGGEFITKDISVVLNTSMQSAEKLKLDYGYADSVDASDENKLPIEVVGQSQPAQISEKILSEIIQARLEQIFGRLKQGLSSISALGLPGGIMLTGGVSALPGIATLAADTFNNNVQVFVPDQMGLRHPSYALALALVSYRANMSEIEVLVRSVLKNGADFKANNLDSQRENDYAENYETEQSQLEQNESVSEPKGRSKNKKKIGQSIQGFFHKLIDD
ncbi:cell division protein FtsA [Lactobacillus sp. Sy-1]|uniref:cell division protein FtsA n=1 Tax=Lactobacillus sp. Sy-1 TaxID=2109645 RepID=UPI001C5A0860|nr:cell division protein FtsA [Lactobacillus sp. Sy-1]MBW1605414.1 cell division protein FtsA [Lactobacillus sp. Sy-1]